MHVYINIPSLMFIVHGTWGEIFNIFTMEQSKIIQKNILSVYSTLSGYCESGSAAIIVVFNLFY